MGDRLETGLTACFNTMINYHLSQKLKLLGNGEYNHLTFTLQNLIEKNKLHQNQSTTHKNFSKKKKKRLKLHHAEFHTTKSSIVPLSPNSPHDTNKSSYPTIRHQMAIRASVKEPILVAVRNFKQSFAQFQFLASIDIQSFQNLFNLQTLNPHSTIPSPKTTNSPNLHHTRILRQISKCVTSATCSINVPLPTTTKIIFTGYQSSLQVINQILTIIKSR